MASLKRPRRRDFPLHFPLRLSVSFALCIITQPMSGAGKSIRTAGAFDGSLHATFFDGEGEVEGRGPPVLSIRRPSPSCHPAAAAFLLFQFPAAVTGPAVDVVDLSKRCVSGMVCGYGTGGSYFKVPEEDFVPEVAVRRWVRDRYGWCCDFGVLYCGRVDRGFGNR